MMTQDDRVAALKRLPLTDGTADMMAVHHRLLALAKRGVNDPLSLTSLEIKQVSYALEVHYAQMGVG